MMANKPLYFHVVLIMTLRVIIRCSLQTSPKVFINSYNWKSRVWAGIQHNYIQSSCRAVIYMFLTISQFSCYVQVYFFLLQLPFLNLDAFRCCCCHFTVETSLLHCVILTSNYNFYFLHIISASSTQIWLQILPNLPWEWKNLFLFEIHWSVG